MNKPGKLYKYESFTAQSLRNLKSQTLYFGSPSNFNDPYDCAIKAKVRKPTDEEIDEFRTIYSSYADLPETAREALKSASSESLRKWLMNVSQDSMNSLAEKNIRDRGVTCFSERNNEPLMWSHYADKQSGFCLEFDTGYEPLSNIKKVKYQSEMPILSITDALVNNNYDQFLELYCTKSKSWSYEKEWRCIHEVSGTKFTYETAALTGVYFGPEIDNEALEIICLVLQGQNPDVQFWKGRRSQESFSIEFEVFEYTSNLRARKLGLIT